MSPAITELALIKSFLYIIYLANPKILVTATTGAHYVGEYEYNSRSTTGI
jgi:hypothetical protein